MNIGDIGTFQVKSGKIRVSDPCYDKDETRCSLVGVVDAVRGEWKAHVKVINEGDWGKRVSYLIAYHSKYFCTRKGLWNRASFDIGVDSGQCGIFDEKHYQDESVIPFDAQFPNLRVGFAGHTRWYKACCNETLKPDDTEAGISGSGTIPFGCVSSSGLGDGCYDCYITKNKAGKVVGIMVDYGLEEMEET